MGPRGTPPTSVESTGPSTPALVLECHRVTGPQLDEGGGRSRLCPQTWSRDGLGPGESSRASSPHGNRASALGALNPQCRSGRPVFWSLSAERSLPAGKPPNAIGVTVPRDRLCGFWFSKRGDRHLVDKMDALVVGVALGLLRRLRVKVGCSMTGHGDPSCRSRVLRVLSASRGARWARSSQRLTGRRCGTFFLPHDFRLRV